MLLTIFYSIGILVFFSAASNLFKLNKILKILEWEDKYEKIVGIKPQKKDYRSKYEYSLKESYAILLSFETLWLIIGIFSDNWYLFVLTFVISWVLKLLVKNIKWTFSHKMLTFCFSLFRVLVYLYLIVNNFFLHIDTLKYIL